LVVDDFMDVMNDSNYVVNETIRVSSKTQSAS
jgi:hypothetical protein